MSFPIESLIYLGGLCRFLAVERATQEARIKKAEIEVQSYNGTTSLTIPPSTQLSYAMDAYMRYLALDLDGHIVYFEWRPSGLIALRNEQKRLHRLNNIDYYIQRKWERELLSFMHVTHKTAELESGSLLVVGDFHRILKLMQLLSDGQCFIKYPTYSIETGELSISWLKNFPIFSFGQLLVASLEVQLFSIIFSSPQHHGYHYQQLNKNTNALQIMHEGLSSLPNKSQVIQRQLHEASLELLLSTDTEKLKCLVQVSLKRGADESLGRLTSKNDIRLHRVWILRYLYSPPTSASTFSLLGIPLEHAMTPLHEILHLGFQRIYKLAAAEYYSNMLQRDETLSALTTAVKITPKKKRKKHKKPKAAAATTVPSGHSSTAVQEAGSALNVSFAPCAVSQRLLDATEIHVLVVQLVHELIVDTLDAINEPEAILRVQVTQNVVSESLETSAVLPVGPAPAQQSEEDPVDEPLQTYADDDEEPDFHEYYPPVHPFLQFEQSDFSFYSMWMPPPRTLVYGGEPLAMLDETIEGQDVMNSPVVAVEDEGEGDFAPLTTAALHAHTVYHKSQVPEFNATTQWNMLRRTEGAKVKSAIAPSIEHGKPFLIR